MIRFLVNIFCHNLPFVKIRFRILIKIMLIRSTLPKTGSILVIRTPLHEAALHGNKRLVLSLLALGADPTRRDKDGKMPR